MTDDQGPRVTRTSTFVAALQRAQQAASAAAEESEPQEPQHPAGPEVVVALQLADGSTFHVSPSAVTVQRPGQGEQAVVVDVDLSAIPSLAFAPEGSA